MTPEEVLEYCWQEIEAGRKTVEECVTLYPDVPNLARHLREASRLRTLGTLAPRPETLRQQETKILARFKKTKRRPQALGLAVPQWSWAGLTLLVLSLVSVMLWVARSTPGEAPYALKQTVEEAQINLTLPDERGSLYADLANRRVEELAVLANRPSAQPSTLAAVLAEATEYTELSLSFITRLPPERRAAVLRQILDSLERQTDLISSVEASAPAELGPQLATAAQAVEENIALATSFYEAATGASVPPSPTLTEIFQALASPTATSILLGEASATPFLSSTATSQPSATASVMPPTASRTPSLVPPTLTNTTQPTFTPTTAPPTLTKTAPPTFTATVVPPTATNAFTPSATPPGQSECASHNPNSPRYCTPTPTP